MLFTGRDCFYEVGRLPANYQSKYPAEYNWYDMYTSHNIKDNEVESVMIPFGLAVTLYDGSDFSGDEITLSWMPYQNEYEEMICQNLDSFYPNLTNRVSSASVQLNGEIGPAKGYWKSIPVTEAASYTISVGFEYDNSETDIYSQQFAFSLNSEVGIFFLEE